MAQNISITTDFETSTTIASGETTSGAIELGGRILAGFNMPAFTGTAIGLLASDEYDGTYKTVNDDAGSPISFTIVANEITIIDPLNTYPLRFIKLVSDATEGAEREIKLMLRPV